MTEVELRKKTLEAFCYIFALNEDEVNDKTGPEDVDTWDSIGHMNLTLYFGEKFGVQMDVDDEMEMTSFGKIVETIKKYVPCE